MGEARRKKMVGYIPQKKVEKPLVIGYGRRNMSLAMVALLAYPSLPNWTKSIKSTESASDSRVRGFL